MNFILVLTTYFKAESKKETNIPNNDTIYESIIHTKVHLNK